MHPLSAEPCDTTITTVCKAHRLSVGSSLEYLWHVFHLLLQVQVDAPCSVGNCHLYPLLVASLKKNSLMFARKQQKVLNLLRCSSQWPFVTLNLYDFLMGHNQLIDLLTRVVLLLYRNILHLRSPNMYFTCKSYLNAT